MSTRGHRHFVVDALIVYEEVRPQDNNFPGGRGTIPK